MITVVRLKNLKNEEMLYYLVINPYDDDFTGRVSRLLCNKFLLKYLDTSSPDEYMSIITGTNAASFNPCVNEKYVAQETFREHKYLTEIAELKYLRF
jgi:hypothetical protein